MDYRRKKLFLALSIMVSGMIFALSWHAWQSWILHQGFPYNTFLYLPSQRFNDLTQVINATQLPTPYQEIRSGYFPTTYAVFGLLARLSPGTVAYLYLSVCCLGLWSALAMALRPIFFNRSRFLYSNICPLLTATVLMLCSYPVWICVDRANIEFSMCALIAWALLFFHRKQTNSGLICLFFPICFKLYPAILMMLFLRGRPLIKVLVVGLLFLLVTYLSFFVFADTMAHSLKLWERNLAYCKLYYLIHTGGLGATASPWSTCKAIMIMFYPAFSIYPDGINSVLDSYMEKLFTAYTIVVECVALLGIAYTVLVETEFFRRTIVLLLIMTLAVPYGNDYRLIYPNIAMIVLILIPTRRKYDFLAVGLLALVTVPKREIYFSYLGVSDTGLHDISLGIFINAPCMILALFLLVKDGWPKSFRSHLRTRITMDIAAYKQVLRKQRPVNF